MSNAPWEDKLKLLFEKATSEVKRAGQDIKQGAEVLLKEVKDPERQKQIKAGLVEFGDWAKKTADEVGKMVGEGVKQAEGAVTAASERLKTSSSTPPPKANATASSSTAAPAPAPAKTAGPSTAKKAGPKKPRVAKKTVGKKPTGVP